MVQNAIAVSTGRKLDVVRIFTSEKELPDVTSLIINKNQGECGIGFTEHFDPQKTREDVYEYNWEEASTQFDLYIESVEKKAAPKKKRTRKVALDLMAKHYLENKQLYPVTIKEKREEIIIILMEGFEVEESFKQVMNT